MGAYQGKNQYVEDIYTFERTDKVSGGDDGIDNVPIKNLTDRTTYLRSIALNSFLDIYGVNPVGTFGIGFNLQESGDGVYDEVSGKWYYWLGSFPKSVAENSSPEDTGGIFDPESNPDGLWTEVIPVNQRQVDMVARAFRVKTEEVQFMKVGRPLDGFRVLYDLTSQEAYRLPMDIPEGSTIVSLTAGGWLVHSNGGVDLSAYAVELEEYKHFTGGDFSTGFTLRQNHCVVMYDGVMYRWDGDFPKTVNANSTPEADGIGEGKWVVVGSNSKLLYTATWSGLSPDQPVTDDRTQRLNLPIPVQTNKLRDDVVRLRDALNSLDLVVATVDEDGKLVEAQLDGMNSRLFSVVAEFAGSVVRRLDEKANDTISALDAGAKGDGTTDDTAAFTALNLAAPGRGVDLCGRTYLVTQFPQAAIYFNGNFLFNGVIYPVGGAGGIISGTGDTGGIGNAYTGGIEAPTVPGRTTPHLYVLVGSQNCRSDGPSRSGNYTSIYSHAGGNLSANIAARQSSALVPQSVNIATEECVIDTGSRQLNGASILSYSEGVSTGNLMSRSSRASSWEAANVASNACMAGAGAGARLLVHVGTDGGVDSIEVLAGGSDYMSPTLEITDRWGQGTGASGTITVTNGVVTSVTVTARGSNYSQVVNGVNAHIYTGRTKANLASTASKARGDNTANIGSSNSDASGQRSVNIANDKSKVSGVGSVNLGGAQNTVTGTQSATIAAGGSEVSADNSVAFGTINKVTAVRSIVMGRRTLNDQPGSLAIGDSGSGEVLSANRKIHLFGNGNATFAGTIVQNGTFTDIAKMFENVDPVAIPVGSLIAWEGRRVRLAEPGDTIFSVHSRTYSILMGDTGFTWAGRYLRDEFGEIILGDVWDEEAYWDQDLNDGEGGFVGGFVEKPLENPEFDPSQEQIARSKRRDTWTPVMLIGEAHVRVDASVSVGDFIKVVGSGLGGRSDERTWLRCMEIRTPFDEDKGYAISLCLGF